MLLYINDSDVCRLNIVLSIHHKNVSLMNKIFKVIWNPATGNYTVT
ncbi:ESPR-type extended signal peptide-containing protein, partial [Escherichia coli]